MRIKVSSWFIDTRFRLRQAAMMWLHVDLKKPLAIALTYTGIVLQMLGKRNSGLKLILKGRRVDNVARANSVIRNIVHQVGGTKSEFHELLGSGSGRPIEDYNGRVLILKVPVLSYGKVTEKGAIIIKFSETFIPVYLLLNVQLLSKYFRIILEPSSVGYSLANILVWTTLDPEKVIVLSPYQKDFEFLSTIKTNLVPIILGPADWVDTSRFHKISDIEKIYDAVYVANYNPIKRVDRYIRAIAQINRYRPDYKAALVCAAKTGAAKREVHATLEYTGNRASIDFIGGMDQASLNVLFNKSKVNVLVSLREGSNKGLAEGLFSGTPALIIEENVGGNHLHINGQTGRIVPDSELENALIWFADHHAEYSPHKWAISHISPLVSTHVLSEKLKEVEKSEGRQWTREIFAKVNRPELAYLDSEHAWLLSKRVELLTKFSHGADEKNIIAFLEQIQKTTAD